MPSATLESVSVSLSTTTSSRSSSSGATSRAARLTSALLIAGRGREAAPLAGDERREADRRPILQIWPDGLQPDRQAAARTPDREGGGRLAGQRRDGRIEEPELSENGLAVHVEGLAERGRRGRPRDIQVRKRRREEGWCEQHVPLPEEGPPRRAVLLALSEPGDVVGRGALDAALLSRRPFVVARALDREAVSPHVVRRARRRHRREQGEIEGVVGAMVAQAVGLRGLHLAAEAAEP